MLEIFDKYRTKEGMIDLDQISNLTFVNMPLRGSRPKFWFSYLDALYLFKEEKIGVHPGVNTATVIITPNDLEKYIRENGNKLKISVL